MKKKYTIEQLNGLKCTHGSPGYPINEVIDELNQIGCEDIANDLQEKLENLLGLSKA